jgi:ABC-type Mn2+/Zn2+ transport system ATPase subunit
LATAGDFEMNPLIEFQHAMLGYGRKIVLNDISFAINAGDYFGMVGPNGAGKTTLLRAILGTLKPQSGKVLIRSATAEPLRFGYVPQRDAIDQIMPYTVQEVVLMGRYRQIGILHRPQKSDYEIVRESLRHVDIIELHDRPFKDLSGGQKQRVLIARALASKPAALILDEPTNGMDLSSKNSILELIHKLHEEDRLTVIMVSHLLDDMANYVKRIALVERNFFQVGAVDDVLTEKNLSALYQMPILVTQVNGSKVILVRGHNGN